MNRKDRRKKERQNCPCGSGMPYRHCCYKYDNEPHRPMLRSLGICLDWNDLYENDIVGPKNLISFIRKYDHINLFRCLLSMDRDLHGELMTYTIQTKNENTLLDNIFTGINAKKVRQWLNSGKRNKIIYPRSLHAAFQLLIRFGEPAKNRIYPDKIHELGEFFLKLNSIINEENFEDPFGIAYRLQFIFSSYNFSTSFVRNYIIFTEGLSNAKEKCPNEYFDIPKKYNQLHGYKIVQMLAIAISLWIRFAHEAEDSLIIDHTYFSKLASANAREIAMKVMESLALSLRDHRDQITKGDDKEFFKFYDFGSFHNYPIIKFDKNRFAPISLELLESKISDGIYWSIIDALQSKKNKNKFSATFGRACEWYVVSLIKNTLKQNYWVDWDVDFRKYLKNSKIVDAIIREDDTLYIIEVTYSAVAPSVALSGDSEKIKSALYNLWFNDRKILQLYEFISNFKNSNELLPEIDRNEIFNYYPLLLQFRSLPLEGNLKGGFYDEILKSYTSEDGMQLDQDFINNLLFIDIEEFEKLLTLKAKGESWNDLIKKMNDGGFKQSSMEVLMDALKYKFETPDILHKYREKAFNEFCIFLFNKGLGRQNFPESQEL